MENKMKIDFEETMPRPYYVTDIPLWKAAFSEDGKAVFVKINNKQILIVNKETRYIGVIPPSEQKTLKCIKPTSAIALWIKFDGE